MNLLNFYHLLNQSVTLDPKYISPQQQPIPVEKNKKNLNSNQATEKEKNTIQSSTLVVNKNEHFNSNQIIEKKIDTVKPINPEEPKKIINEIPNSLSSSTQPLKKKAFSPFGNQQQKESIDFSSNEKITNKQEEQIDQLTFHPENKHSYPLNDTENLSTPKKIITNFQEDLTGKKLIGVITYLVNYNELVLTTSNKKINIKINLINDFDFPDPEINNLWHKSLKNFLFKNLIFKNNTNKILAIMKDNQSAEIFFDYELKDSLYSRINNYREEFFTNMTKPKFTPKKTI